MHAWFTDISHDLHENPLEKEIYESSQAAVIIRHISLVGACNIITYFTLREHIERPEIDIRV